MRLNRVTCGVVAGAVGIAAGVAVMSIEARIFRQLEPNPKIFWGVFFTVGCAVFAAADWLGILSAPYEPPPDIIGTREIAANPTSVPTASEGSDRTVRQAEGGPARPRTK